MDCLCTYFSMEDKPYLKLWLCGGPLIFNIPDLGVPGKDVVNPCHFPYF